LSCLFCRFNDNIGNLIGLYLHIVPVVVCSRKNKDKSEFLSGRSVGRLLLSSGN
jgi:hypothetical protein